MLAAYEHALQTCVYCPKLCRACCPVSNAAASETLTPWGKMSLAYFVHRGNVALDPAHALPAWGCTSCGACRERCEHHNDVARVLLAARGVFASAGAAPPAARGVSERWPLHLGRIRDRLEDWAGAEDVAAPTALLVGCSYVRHATDAARSVLEVASHFLGGRIRVLRACCGLPLRLAGDERGFVAAAQGLAAALRSVRRLVVADPGCARTLSEDYPRLGLRLPRLELLVDVMARGLERLPERSLAGLQVRYHDGCHLARSFGCVAAPRAVLSHLTGQEPARFVRSGAQTECCGAGDLLPLTYPEWSRAIADARIAEHRSAGGGLLVASCGASLHRFRTRGQDAVDLTSLVARALERRVTTRAESDGCTSKT